jgi:hypothetical protein
MMDRSSHVTYPSIALEIRGRKRERDGRALLCSALLCFGVGGGVGWDEMEIMEWNEWDEEAVVVFKGGRGCVPGRGWSPLAEGT